jgi:hypothetical protein
MTRRMMWLSFWLRCSASWILPSSFLAAFLLLCAPGLTQGGSIRSTCICLFGSLIAGRGLVAAGMGNGSLNKQGRCVGTGKIAAMLCRVACRCQVAWRWMTMPLPPNWFAWWALNSTWVNPILNKEAYVRTFSFGLVRVWWGHVILLLSVFCCLWGFRVVPWWLAGHQRRLLAERVASCHLGMFRMDVLALSLLPSLCSAQVLCY